MNTQRITKRALGALLLCCLTFGIASGCGEVPVDDAVLCCKLPDGTYSSETTSDCKELNGALVDADFCAVDEEICCELDDGTFQTLPESECENIAAPDRCLDVNPNEEICCKTDDGYQNVPASECPDSQIATAEMCTDEDVCCEMADGTFQTLPESECEIIASPDRCLDVNPNEEICCKTDDGFQTLPASECSDDQIVSAEMCIDEDVCCEMADGTFQTLPESQCETIASPDRCLAVIEETCCRIDGQFVTVPVDECPDGQLAPAELCIEDAEVCCETATGLMTLPASQCPTAQQVSADMCEQELCCKTADGNVFVPADQCEPMSVLADDECVNPEPECTKFRAVDMSTLPYTTTAGDTLQSFTSFWGTFPVQTGWSSACLDQPAGAERAVTGFGNDLVLEFAAPISSIYLLRYHAQVGDDLVVPGANLTPTFCGASGYNNITRVDLPTPSSTVTVQDISPDGGSGYSVLLAECIEWK